MFRELKRHRKPKSGSIYRFLSVVGLSFISVFLFSYTPSIWFDWDGIRPEVRSNMKFIEVKRWTWVDPDFAEMLLIEECELLKEYPYPVVRALSIGKLVQDNPSRAFDLVKVVFEDREFMLARNEVGYCFGCHPPPSEYLYGYVLGLQKDFGSQYIPASGKALTQEERDVLREIYQKNS